MTHKMRFSEVPGQSQICLCNYAQKNVGAHQKKLGSCWTGIGVCLGNCFVLLWVSLLKKMDFESPSVSSQVWMCSPTNATFFVPLSIFSQLQPHPWLSNGSPVYQRTISVHVGCSLGAINPMLSGCMGLTGCLWTAFVQQIQPTPPSVALHMATKHMLTLIPIRLCPVMAIKHPGNLRIRLDRRPRQEK